MNSLKLFYRYFDITDRCLYWISNLFISYVQISAILSFVKFDNLCHVFVRIQSENCSRIFEQIAKPKYIVNVKKLPLVLGRTFNSQ